MSRWAAAEGPINGYSAAKLLTFDVIVNQTLEMGMSDEEMQEFSNVFQVGQTCS
jgi:hypothetical protein